MHDDKFSTVSDEEHSEFVPHLQTPSVHAELFVGLQTAPLAPQTHFPFKHLSLNPEQWLSLVHSIHSPVDWHLCSLDKHVP